METLVRYAEIAADPTQDRSAKAAARKLLWGIDANPIVGSFGCAAPENLNWSTLKDFLEENGKTLTDLICDLKFGLLD